MQLAAFDIKARHVGRPSRHNDRTIIFLGQALQPFASVHGIAYGGDDLRARRPHRADNGLAEMDADSDPNRLRQVPSQSAVELATRASISRAPRKASAAPIAGFLALRP